MNTIKRHLSISAIIALTVLLIGFGIVTAEVRLSQPPGSSTGGTTTIINNFINQGASTYLVSGGEVSWLSNLVFRVNAAQYVIDGVTYNSTATNVTLSAADATNPRVDVFTLNTSSVVEVEEGTPSTSPAKSTVPANQLEISFVQINPNETTPAITRTWIYRENTEWTAAGVGTTWVVDSTNQAYNGTKSVSGASINAATEYVTFTTAATDISNVGLVQLSIWVDNVWATSNYLRARLYNGGTAVSGYVNLVSGYGMNYTTTGSWQVVTIPIGAFNLTSTTITALRIEGFGSGNKNFYLDDINLQAGLPQVSAVATYKTVTGNTGSTTANSPSDVLNIRGLNGAQVDVTNDRIDIYPPAAPFNPYNQLYSGSVTWIATNHYFVSPLSYAIQGVGYTTASTNIYLTAAPNAPTNRVDYIVATDQSTVAVVTGTPATTALTPLVSASTQLPITAALQITGGQTSPDGFSAELLYDENTGPAAEWTVSTTGANVNADETTGSIYSGSKVIAYDGTVTFADYATITKATDKALIGSYWLSFAVKFDAVPTGTTMLIDSYLDGNWIGGALADLELWGVNKNDTVNWQVVSIPINVITGSSAWVDTFEIGAQTDMRIDKIRLVAGTGPTYPQSAFSRVVTDTSDGYDVEAYTPNSVLGIKGLGGITTTNYGGSVYINGAALAGLQTAVSTNLAAGIPTVVGSQLRVGTNSVSGAYQMFSGQVSTNGSYNMTTADIGKLFSYDVTSSPTFTLTNANLFAAGQAVAFIVDSGTTNTFSKQLELKAKPGESINSQTNVYFGVKHDSVILVSDGVSKWHPIGLQNSFQTFAWRTNSLTLTKDAETVIGLNKTISDPFEMHSETVNPERMYAPVDGFYFVEGAVIWSAPTSGAKGYAGKLIRGSDGTYMVIKTDYSISGAASVENVFLAIIFLTAGDYVRLAANHNDAATEALYTPSTDYSAYMRMTRIK